MSKRPWVLPSEVLLREFLELATLEGWRESMLAMVRQRAVLQRESVERALASDRLLDSPDCLKLDTLAKETHRIEQEVLASLVGLRPDPRAIAEEMLARFNLALKAVPDALGDRIDADLALRHRNLAALVAQRESNGMVGLALSGGGIRSASFSIGVLQALASKTVLPAFHYVSAVSGGGYAASWLVAWAYRHRDGIGGVQRELIASAGDCGPLKWVRRYGSYLATQLGALSTEVWSLVVAYLRNWFPVFLLIVCSLMPFLLVPHIFVRSVAAMERGPADPPDYFAPATLALAVVALLLFLTLLRYLLRYRRVVRDAPQSGSVKWYVVGASIAAFIAAAVPFMIRNDVERWLSSIFALLPSRMRGLEWILFPLAGAFIQLIALVLATVVRTARGGGAQAEQRRVMARTSIHRAALAVLVGGFVFGAVMLLCVHAFAPFGRSPRLLSTVMPIAIVAAFGIAEIAIIVLTTGLTDDDDRAWQAQLGGWILAAGIGWTLLSSLSIWLWSGFSSLPAWIALAAFLAPALGALAPLQHRRLAGIAVWSIVVPLLFLASVAGLVNIVAVHAAPSMAWLIGVCLGFAAAAAMMGFAVDVNHFSLHDLYRERLTRTFLGASRLSPDNTGVAAPATVEEEQERQFRRRAPSAFTNIDEDDSPLLHWVRPVRINGSRRLPLLLLNAAVNGRSRTETGGRAPRQWSFSFGPYHCGSMAPGVGFMRTDSFMTDPNGRPLALGTAMAVSGAAMSPTAGRMTHPMKALLFAIMNARLGMWVRNPGGADKAPSAGTRRVPGISLLIELLSFRPYFSQWIHLSDGGHFENLGVFELLRRGCNRIVVVDASCDPDRSFDDLANAIRRARIDLGVRIHRSPVDPWEIFGPSAAAPAKGVRDHRKCWMWFEIDYGRDADGASVTGRLLYLKPSVYDGQPLPPEVMQYWSISPRFPHETTADQFFTEAQMEAYRSLGEACGVAAFSNGVMGSDDEPGDRVLRDTVRRLNEPQATSGFDRS